MTCIYALLYHAYRRLISKANCAYDGRGETAGRVSIMTMVMLDASAIMERGLSAASDQGGPGGGLADVVTHRWEVPNAAPSFERTVLARGFLACALNATARRGWMRDALRRVIQTSKGHHTVYTLQIHSPTTDRQTEEGTPLLPCPAFVGLVARLRCFVDWE